MSVMSPHMAKSSQKMASEHAQNVQKLERKRKKNKGTCEKYRTQK